MVSVITNIKYNNSIKKDYDTFYNIHMKCTDSKEVRSSVLIVKTKPRKPGFSPVPVPVEFMVDKVALIFFPLFLYLLVVSYLFCCVI